MNYRFLASLVAFAVILTAPLPAQAPAKAKKATPRTADGHPDLQGTWTNATLTPMQRPVEFAAKPFFTEQEAAAYEKRRLEETNVDRPEAKRAGDPGAY